MQLNGKIGSMNKKIVFLQILLILISLIGVYFQNMSEDKGEKKIQKVDEEVDIKEYEEEEKEEVKKEPAEIYTFVEEIIYIGNQPMYYAYPQDTKHTPKLIIYSHGELRKVVTNKNDKYMIDVKEYAQFYARQGYAFAASNEFDDGWGEKKVLDNLNNVLNWFKKNNLDVDEKVKLIGFSMGSLSSINFAIENNDKVSNIILLAPSSNMNIKKNDVEKIKDIPIKIFHGIDDKNIPVSSSIEYANLFKSFDKDVTLKILEDADHYSLEFLRVVDF